MPEDFAKLFKVEPIGQILVTIDQTEDMDKSGPEVKISFRAPGFGVCATKFNFTDDDKGWDDAETMFGKLDEVTVVGIVTPIIKQFSECFVGIAE